MRPDSYSAFCFAATVYYMGKKTIAKKLNCGTEILLGSYPSVLVSKCLSVFIKYIQINIIIQLLTLY